MTKKDFLNRMTALTEKAYDFNINSAMNEIGQKVIISTMYHRGEHSIKICIFNLDENGLPVSCVTYYDQHDRKEINELFNI